MVARASTSSCASRRTAARRVFALVAAAAATCGPAAADPGAPRLVPIAAAPGAAVPTGVVPPTAAGDPPLVRIGAAAVPPAASAPRAVAAAMPAPRTLRALPVEPVVPPPVASGMMQAPVMLRSLPIEPVMPAAVAARSVAPLAAPIAAPAPVTLRSLPVADVAPPRQQLATVSLAPPEAPRPLAPLPTAQSEHALPPRPPAMPDAIASLPPPRQAAPLPTVPLPPLPSVPSVSSSAALASPPSVAAVPAVPSAASPRMMPPPAPVAAAAAPPTPIAPPQMAAQPLAPPPSLQPPALQPPPVAPQSPSPQQVAGPGSTRSADPSTAPPEQPRAAGPGKPADAIVIGSFNIQVFGESKLAKQPVVDVLARVVRGFDVVAIQEVRAKSDNVIPQFVAAVNADGSRYQYVVGPRLGRTVSKEQYAFIYDSTRIEIDPGSVGTMPEPADRLHRPPLHARFRVRANPPESGFSFWLVDTHTDPDEVKQEVDALADVFVAMRSLRPDEDDVILLGDFNASPAQFGKIRSIPGIGWAVSNATTNTRRTKTYDNLVFVPAATAEYTGRWGVLDLQQTFGLSLDKALEVSDHNPVWAAFRPWEAPRVPLTAQAPAADTPAR